MKKLFIIISFIFMAYAIFAQTPNKLNPNTQKVYIKPEASITFLIKYGNTVDTFKKGGTYYFDINLIKSTENIKQDPIMPAQLIQFTLKDSIDFKPVSYYLDADNFLPYKVNVDNNPIADTTGVLIYNTGTTHTITVDSTDNTFINIVNINLRNFK